MDLLSAIGSTDGLVCVVGAGGKTTTMYALASRLQNAVVTSTVRIPVFDTEVTDVLVTENPVTVLEAEQSFPLGLVPEREGSNRYRGYDPETVDELATAHDGPVLVKADGARMREFKAPGENEPQIPASADVVVPVVSSHVVGKPLTGHWVHRPERVGALTGTEIGDEITPETVARVLAHEQGGLKGVPEGATVVPFVTKVDSADHEQVGRAIGDAIYESLDDSTVEVPRVALARFDAFDAVERSE